MKRIRKRCTACGKVKMVKPRDRVCWQKRPGFSIYRCGGKLAAAPIQRKPKPPSSPLEPIRREIEKAKKNLHAYTLKANRAQRTAIRWGRKLERLEKKRDEIEAALVTYAGQVVRTGSLHDHRARGIALGDA